MTGLFRKNLAVQLEIDDAEIASRMQMLNFSATDVNELKVFAGAAREISTEVIAEFYRHQIRIPEIRRMIGDTETLARLMEAMQDYVASLFGGVYDTTYVNDRLRVGQIHARVGVAPKHYVASMFLLKDLIGDYLMSSGLIVAPPKALDKLFLFDLQLIFDIYLHGLATELEAAHDRARAAAGRRLAEDVSDNQGALDDVLRQAMRRADSQGKVA